MMALQMQCTITVFTLITLSLTNGAPAKTTLQVESYPLEQDSNLSLDKRPKYMDTRRDLDILKGLILLSIQELEDEERLNPEIVREDESPEPTEEKRERYMGICMRKQYNNFIPFPCLRNGR